jgi:hypothetical protein
MSSSHLYFLLSFVSLIWTAFGDECQPKAISLPYTSTKLISNAEVRGVLWQIGGPNPQNITLMPSASVKPMFPKENSLTDYSVITLTLIYGVHHGVIAPPE